MKNLLRLFLSFLAFFVTTVAYSQNVAINTSATPAHQSAMLDISATNKGLLIPRMGSSLRTAIASPATGLQVFDTDTKSFWFWNGTIWVELSIGSATGHWNVNGTNIYNNNAGNVGIGLTTPLAALHIKKDNEAIRLQGSTPYISFYDNAGTNKSFIQSFNSSLYIGTPSTNTNGNLQFYLKNIPVMTMLPSGNVGIGTDVPDEKLTVQTLNNSYGIFHRGEGGNILGTRMGGTSAGIGTFSNTNLRIYANGNSAMFINAGDSYVGVGVDFPANKLQVGPIGNTGYTGNDFVIGNGINALRMYQTSTVSLIASSADIMFWPKEKAGNVGVNCNFPPTNKLQIGDIGGSGFATNDLAIGNGTNAMAIQQTNATTLIGSTTDIILKPRNNGAGRVGINTNTPRAALDVTSYVNAPIGNFAYYAFTYDNFQPATNVGANGNASTPVNISIYASDRVVASEFNAYSDSRIKDIAGISNSSTDLATINAIAITNYTMKDKVKYGNQKFKKVIAQEVEKVYPQVVTKHTDFVPNVYQVTTNVQKTTGGYLLSFTGKHNISNEAKKLRVLLNEREGVQSFGIVSMPSDKQVIVSAEEIKGDKVFVYGEEVDDFRTVDYEGLTTLNISATQELSKLFKKQQDQLDAQNKKIEQLTEIIKGTRDIRIVSAKGNL